MRVSGQRRRAALLGCVAAIAALIGLVAWWAGALDRPERGTVDARFEVRGARTPPASVVVVGVDERSMDALGTRWPFSRAVQARAIARLTAARPRVIAYDIQMSEPTTDGDDQAMADALGAAGPVVLATTLYDPDQGPGVLFEGGAITVGHAAYPDTPDNVFRRVPLAVDGLPSFAAAAAAAARGGEPAPGDAGGSALIDYAGPEGTIPAISYSDVLDGRFDAARVRGRVVVVGTTAPRLGDTHPTPYGGAPMSGPEINANAIATLLDGSPLSDAPGWVDALAVIALAALGALAAWPRRAWITLLAAVLIGVVWVLLAQAAFAAGTVVAVTPPLLALALAAVGGLVATYGLLERERARLRAEFARFVPAAVVDEVVEQAGEDHRLGGRRVYCTVMFADLRGFTAAAERLPPETVIELLNRYLGEMSDAILDNGGTLVSYMGDGIMALFGAPIAQEDHADRAVAAAREMRDVRLPGFNAWLEQRVPGTAFRMGVGLASGPVMSGSVGSERRLEYTAVGDTANVASRLQALTKEVPHAILLADSTRAALSRPVTDLEAVGALDVRGRQVGTGVWTLADATAGEPVSRG